MLLCLEVQEPEPGVSAQGLGPGCLPLLVWPKADAQLCEIRVIIVSISQGWDETKKLVCQLLQHTVFKKILV